MPCRSAVPRLLVLVRHAQAESWASSDHARRLTERGRGDAVAAGRWLDGALRAEGVTVPDVALVSDAARAQETWAAMAAAAGWDPAVEPDRAVYEATAPSLLDLVRLVDDEARSVVVVGHNPTIAVLTQLLDDGTGDPDAAEAAAAGHPTAGVALLAVRGSWAGLADAGAALREFHVGRG